MKRWFSHPLRPPEPSSSISPPVPILSVRPDRTPADGGMSGASSDGTRGALLRRAVPPPDAHFSGTAWAC